PPTISPVPTPLKTTTAVNLPASTDARLRLDLLENAPEQAVGKKDLFHYQQAQLPPPPPGARGGPPLNPVTPISTTPPVVRTPGPPPTPPQPPIPLKFQGFAVTETPDRTLHAFLADDARHYD